MINYFYINNLYNLYSYRIDFNVNEADTDSYIKFITGPNGYGKTTILKIINAILTNKLSKLFSISFDNLEIGIDNAVLKIQQSDIVSDTKLSKDFDFSLVSKRLECSFLSSKESSSVSEFILDEVREPLVELLANEKKKVKLSGNKNEFDLFIDSRLGYFISEKRVVDSMSSPLNDGTYTSSLKEFANDLKILISVFRVKLPMLAFNLDGKVDVNSATKDEIEAYNIFNSLRAYDLIDMSSIMSVSNDVSFIDIYRNNKMIIDECFGGVKYILKKIQLFDNIISEANLANKDIQFSSKYGFRFKMRDKNNTILTFNDLSSGEKHIVTQYYNMLFTAVTDKMVVLIDEPEISFHMMWLTNYLNNIRKIVDLRKTQFIIATHSPDIFNSKWSLTYDLYEGNECKEQY